MTPHRDADEISRLQSLYGSAAGAAFVQLGCTLMTMVIVFTLGAEPETAEAYFQVLGNDRLEGILRTDFASLLNVALFTITSFALFVTLRDRSGVYAGLAAAAVWLGVAIAVAVHPGLSIIHLSDAFAAATDEAARGQLLAAGDAVLAAGWWHSTAGTMAGIFLQGGMVLISAIMLRSAFFSNATAITGLLANGLDLLHILVGFVLPSVGIILLMIGGAFYLAWFPLLGRDFYRLAGRAAPSALAPA